MMKKTALILLSAATLASLGACGKKPQPQPPVPPAPIVPEAPPPAPPPPARTEAPAQVDEYARLRAMSAEEIEKSGLLAEIYFDLDKADLRDADRETLTKNAAALKRFDFLRVTVEGHCDERGTVEYNQALGEKRAQAARDYLVSAGIDGGRIQIISYGKERPFSDGHDESAWQQNRRAHFVSR